MVTRADAMPMMNLNERGLGCETGGEDWCICTERVIHGHFVFTAQTGSFAHVLDFAREVAGQTCGHVGNSHKYTCV